MTKVQLHYDLLRPLTDADAEGIASVHGYYGIMRVWVAPALDRITVDYDASRLSVKDVGEALINHGVPIRREAAVAG